MQLLDELPSSRFRHEHPVLNGDLTEPMVTTGRLSSSVRILESHGLRVRKDT